MKAVLEFTLPEEEHDFRVACLAPRVLSALREVDEALRSKLKYGPPLPEPASEILQTIRDILWDAVPDALEGELG